MSLKIIFGLGNPGKQYEGTRHNIGFEILDKFAEKHKLTFSEGKGEYYIAGSKDLFASSFFLVKPTTYVNLSGVAAYEIFDRFDVEPENFLVVIDDLNLPLGKIRIRQRGGDGGHNGLFSIINSLETDFFPRLRFGIGKEIEEGKMADFVLSKFDEDERKIIDEKIEDAVELIEAFIKDGYEGMANLLSLKNQKTHKELQA